MFVDIHVLYQIFVQCIDEEVRSEMIVVGMRCFECQECIEMLVVNIGISEEMHAIVEVEKRMSTMMMMMIS